MQPYEYWDDEADEPETDASLTPYGDRLWPGHHRVLGCDDRTRKPKPRAR